MTKRKSTLDYFSTRSHSRPWRWLIVYIHLM